MNVNNAYKFNVRNINFVLIYVNYMPIVGKFTYQEGFRSLATANSAILSRLMHPYTAPEPNSNLLKSLNFVELLFRNFPLINSGASL